MCCPQLPPCPHSGPSFIAQLLPAAAAALPSFSGPQLSRLALGLARLGYQPDDPWVGRLQREAARKLRQCDGHELIDLMEGLVLLAEGCEGGQEHAGVVGGSSSRGGGGGGGGREGREGRVQAGPCMDPGLLEAFWAASVEVMEADAWLLEQAAARGVRQRVHGAISRRDAGCAVRLLVCHANRLALQFAPSMYGMPAPLSARQHCAGQSAGQKQELGLQKPFPLLECTMMLVHWLPLCRFAGPPLRAAGAVAAGRRLAAAPGRPTGRLRVGLLGGAAAGPAPRTR